MATSQQLRGPGPKDQGKAKPETGRRDAGPGSLAGNLTRDPELRYTPQGTAVASLRVAVTPRVYNERKQQWEDGETTFHDVAAWGRLAENVAEHLGQGNRIVCEGRWEEQSWEDPEGNVQQRAVLVATDLGPSLKWQGARIMPKKPRQS